MNRNGNGRNGRAATVTAVSAILVALIGNGTVYTDSRSARADLRREMHRFESAQCNRDELRDAVIVQALKDAQRRAEASIPDPLDQAHAIGAIQSSIDQLSVFGRQCRASLD